MVAQTNHQLSYYAVETKVDTRICLRMRKTSKGKTLLSDFKITIPENPLLLQQAVISKGIPTYS